MTRVFSGGIAHEFYDCTPSAAPAAPGTRIGAWGYGLVRDDEVVPGGGRSLTKLPDFLSLRARLERVCEVDGMPVFQRRMSEETIDDDEGLSSLDEGEESSSSSSEEEGDKRRAFPPLSAHWRAGYALPSVADWNGVRKNLEEKIWIEVDGEEMEHANEHEVGLESSNPRLVRA